MHALPLIRQERLPDTEKPLKQGVKHRKKGRMRGKYSLSLRLEISPDGSF